MTNKMFNIICGRPAKIYTIQVHGVSLLREKRTI